MAVTTGPPSDDLLCRCGVYTSLLMGQSLCPCQSRWLFALGVLTDGKFLLPMGRDIEVVVNDGPPGPAPTPPPRRTGDVMRADDI